MTMDNSFQIPTLLPYLQFSPGRAALKISRIHENLAPADRPKFPFVTAAGPQRGFSFSSQRTNTPSARLFQ